MGCGFGGANFFSGGALEVIFTLLIIFYILGILLEAFDC
ncbi:hypothetical protein SAMN00017405_2298 [Desulfonispora thiosulfatigenes DSM 11270]|uniref:Uncharacterized protein n=1 Tax=Desulfonispora thiosulfatigenes DSM 11270 TaxID=656914 RepID=A0A1W1VD98_DESTI|nr:hypothetical protein SAMN00017405_2298 [Desulfonispora thiosulfatigenes DSM 11270]